MTYITSIERLAKKEGRQEGRQEGVITGKIQLFQQLLGEAVSAFEELEERSKDSLKTQLAELQMRWDKKLLNGDAE